MPTQIGEMNDTSLDSTEVLSARLSNLRYWIGELVIENHRLRMAIHERALSELLQEQQGSLYRDVLFSSQSIRKIHGTSLS